MGVNLQVQPGSYHQDYTSQANPPAFTFLQLRVAVDMSVSVSAQLYLQIHDTSSNPAAGAQCLLSQAIDAHGNAVLDFGLAGLSTIHHPYFTLSSTPLVYTEAIDSVTTFGLNAIFLSLLA